MAVSSEFIIRAVLDMSDPKAQIKAFEQWAAQRGKAANIPTAGKLTAAQRVGPVGGGSLSAVLGGEQAQARVAYEQGKMGVPGSKDAQAQLRRVYQAQRDVFSETISGFTPKQLKAFNTAVTEARKAVVEQIYAAAEASKQPIQAPRTVKSLTASQREQQAAIEKKLGKETVEENLKSLRENKKKTAAAAAAARNEAEVAKATQLEAEAALNAATIAENNLVKAGTRAVEKQQEAEKQLAAAKKETLAANKAAEAELAEVRRRKKGGVGDAKAKVERVREEGEARVRASELNLARANQAQARAIDKALKAAPVKEEAEVAAARTREPAARAAERQAQAERLDAAADQSITEENKKLAAIREQATIERETAEKALKGAAAEALEGEKQQEADRLKTSAQLAQANAERERAVVEKIDALTGDTRAERQARLGRGVRGLPSGPETDPTRDIKKRLARQERKIAENDLILGTETPRAVVGTTSELLAEQQQILTQQNVSMRRSKVAREAAEKEAQIAAERSAAYGPATSKYDAEALEATAARAEAIRFGAAKEAAYLRDMDGIERGINAEKSSIRTLVGEERALAAARVALEESATAKAVENLGLRDTIVQGKFDTTKEAVLQEAALQAKLAADEKYVATTAEVTAGKKKAAVLEANAVRATLAADAEYVAAVQAGVLSKQQETLASLKFKATSIAYQEAEVAIQREGNAIKQAMHNLEYQQLLLDEVALKEKAKGIVLEEQYNRALNKEVRTQAAAAGLTQRGLIARLRGSGGGGAGGGGGRYGIGDQGGTADFFRGGAASTLRHAIPSIALFAGAAGIVSTVKSAEELERQMVLIEGQFKAVDKAAEFPQFKQTILEIARGSGLAAEEVAAIGFQLKGAFDALDAQSQRPVSLGGFSGQALVDEQLQASAEIAKVTGLSQQEIVDSLTATSLAFGTTFREIGDVTLSLQGRFGVLAKEIIPFLGDIAPVAKDAGFSLEEFATIAAITQQKSGRSGTALAEAYGRVLPAITEAKTELIGLASTNDSLNNQDFLRAVSEGDVGEIFLQLADSFNAMNTSSQDFVINLLGGRREASAILSAFSDGDTLMKQIRDTERDRGQLAERFLQLQETLAQKVDILKEKFRQLGLEIYESGLADVLGLLADVISLASTGAVAMLQAFGGLNDAVGGLPAKLLAVLAVIKLIQAASRRTSFQNLGSTIAGGVNNFAAGARAMTGAPTGAGGQMVLPGMATRGQSLRGAVAAAPSIGGANAVGIAALSLFELQNARNEAAAGIEAAGERVTTALENASTEEVQAFIDERQTFMDQVRTDGWAATVGAWVTGTSNLQQTAIDVSQEESSGRMVAALEEAARVAAESTITRTTGSGITYQVTEASINELIARFEADPTNDALYEEVRTVLEGFAGVDSSIETRLNEALQGHINLSEAEATRQEATDAAREAATTAATDLESVKAQYESGSASIVALEAAYTRSITSMREALALSVEDDPKIVQALQEAELARSQVVSAALNDMLDLRQQIEGFSGRGGPAREVEQLVGLLNDPRFSDPQARRQAVLDILTLQQEILDARAEAADDAGEAIEILENGIKIPRSARVELVRQQLGQNNVRFARFIDDVVAINEGLANSFRQQLIRALASGRRGIRALRRQLQAERDALQSYLQSGGGSIRAAEQASEQQNAYDRLLEELESRNPFGVQVPNRVRGSRDSRQQYQEEQQQAAAEYAQSVADAQEQAAEDAREAAEELADARADYFLALVENDPVAVAQHQLSEADRMYRKATTEAERVRAQAERIRAQRQLQEAIQDVFASQFDLLTAMFGYSGDTVKVAQVALKQAQQQLAFLQRQGAGDAEINRAKAAIIDAQGGLRDARLNRKLEDYAFLYDMEKINKQQYIAYLMQLRETPDLTRDQLRALDRQIKQLRDDLGADFQFNLPTNLALPTLYEVRRAGQTPGGAGAYTDNRVVTVNVNVESAADLQALERVLADSVGQNVNGTVARRY